MPRYDQSTIALWGGASLSNVGDRMLFDVVERELARRMPGATFIRYCPWAGDAGDVLPLWVDASGCWPGSGSARSIVVVGGVFAGPPFGNVIMRAFSLGATPAAFDPSVVAAWLGVGLDDDVLPGMKPEWRRYLKALAGRLDFFTVRAPNAANRFRQAGAPVPEVVPDPSFALPVREPSGARRPGKQLRIGVAIGEAMASERLRNTITDMRAILRCVQKSGIDLGTLMDAVESVDNHLAEVATARKQCFSRLLSAQLASLSRLGAIELIGIDNMYDDAQASAAFAAALGGMPVRHVPGECADALRAALGSYDLVVVSRFHSVVLAMQAGVPFIAADPYWNPDTGTSKVHQLLETLGCGDRHWTGAASAATLRDLVDYALIDATDDRDRYTTLHVRAHATLDQLVTVLASGRG